MSSAPAFADVTLACDGIGATECMQAYAYACSQHIQAYAHACIGATESRCAHVSNTPTYRQTHTKVVSIRMAYAYALSSAPEARCAHVSNTPTASSG